LNHFVEFAIVNELLIIEDRRINARDRIGPPQPNAATVPLRGTRRVV